MDVTEMVEKRMAETPEEFSFSGHVYNPSSESAVSGSPFGCCRRSVCSTLNGVFLHRRTDPRLRSPPPGVGLPHCRRAEGRHPQQTGPDGLCRHRLQQAAGQTGFRYLQTQPADRPAAGARRPHHGVPQRSQKSTRYQKPDFLKAKLHPVTCSTWTLFSGVGHQTAKRLLQLGVVSVKELQLLPLSDLVKEFGGAVGQRLKKLSLGDDDSPVTPSGAPQVSWDVH